MKGAEPLIWVTRAEPGASATAERIRALGFAPLIAPLLTVRAIETSPELDDVGALAFTSANGVKAFAARSTRRDLDVFTVGDATAQAAREAGFQAVTSANGDALALVKLIVRALSPRAGPSGVVLAPGPLSPAVDLVRALGEAGVAARAVALYETLAPETLPDAARKAMTDNRIDAAVIHSARAAHAFAALTAPFDLSSVSVIGLSTACLSPLAALVLRARATAAAPREDALLDALAAALGKPSRAR